MRKGVELTLQALIDAEATAQIGAERFGKRSSRTTQRNGTRERLLSTTAGNVDLKKVNDLVVALGLESGTSKSEVSPICAELDKQLGAFRARSLAHVEFPDVFFDATYLKGRSTTRSYPGRGDRRGTERSSAVRLVTPKTGLLSRVLTPASGQRTQRRTPDHL